MKLLSYFIAATCLGLFAGCTQPEIPKAKVFVDLATVSTGPEIISFDLVQFAKSDAVLGEVAERCQPMFEGKTVAEVSDLLKGQLEVRLSDNNSGIHEMSCRQQSPLTSAATTHVWIDVTIKAAKEKFEKTEQLNAAKAKSKQALAKAEMDNSETAIEALRIAKEELERIEALSSVALVRIDVLDPAQAFKVSPKELEVYEKIQSQSDGKLPHPSTCIVK